MTEPPLHEDVAHLAFLLGTWTGEGEGVYPTTEPFRYGEEVRFFQAGKPFIAYTQRTWHLDDRRPLHAEMGYWRPDGRTGIELVLAHPTGIVEVEEGSLDGQTIETGSVVVGRSSTAKEVTRLERTIAVDGDVMRYGAAHGRRRATAPAAPDRAAGARRRLRGWPTGSVDGEIPVALLDRAPA